MPTCHFQSNGRSYHYDILRGQKVCIIALRSSFGLSSADDENHSNQSLDVFSLHPGPACHGVAKLTNIDQLSRSVFAYASFMASTPLVRFTHIVSSANQTLFESRCMACGWLVAASQNKKYLKIAELAHHCPARPQLRN
jgi:hypothetical protein